MHKLNSTVHHDGRNLPFAHSQRSEEGGSEDSHLGEAADGAEEGQATVELGDIAPNPIAGARTTTTRRRQKKTKNGLSSGLVDGSATDY